MGSQSHKERKCSMCVNCDRCLQVGTCQGVYSLYGDVIGDELVYVCMCECMVIGLGYLCVCEWTSR